MWKQLGQPALQPSRLRYVSATGNPIPVMGMFKALAALTHSSSLVGQLNGQKWNCNFDIDVRSLIQNQIHVAGPAREKIKTVGTETPDARLHQACSKLCEQFTDLFKPELGCLKDVELEVQFKLDFKPVFCKPRTVPFALLEDLNQAYDEDIKKGIWVPTPLLRSDWSLKAKNGSHSVLTDEFYYKHDYHFESVQPLAISKKLWKG